MRSQLIFIFISLFVFVSCGRSPTGDTPTSPTPLASVPQKNVVPTTLETVLSQTFPYYSPAKGGTGSLTFREIFEQSPRSVVYFYPMDNTPGCTMESIAFSRLQEKYREKGYQIIGVSRDSLASHMSFAKTNELTIDLIEDSKWELYEAFHQDKLSSSWKLRWVPAFDRTTYVTDASGMILQAYRSVNPADHPETLLKSLR